jgi:hypothetical protein
MNVARGVARSWLSLGLVLVLGCGDRSGLDVDSIDGGHTRAPGGGGAQSEDATADAAGDGSGGSAPETSCRWVFRSPATYAAGPSPVAVGIGDFDADGHPDLAVDNYGGIATEDTLNVLRNKGDGTFTAEPSSYESEVAFTLAVGSFVSPLSTDVAVGCQIFPGAGAGAFGTPVTFAEEDDSHCDIMTTGNNLVSADFDGDGRPDLAWVFYDVVAVFLNRGGGAFDEVDTTTFAESAAVADLNGDGRPDLAVTNWGYGNPGSLKILLNAGGGTFTEQDIPEGAGTPTDVATGDFNGDGRIDVAVFDSTHQDLEIRLNLGGAAFGPPMTYPAGSEVRSMATGDVNGDGWIDVVMADYSTSSLDIFPNRGDGTFGPRLATALVSQPDSMALGDLNADGHLDIALAGPSSIPTDNVVTVLLSSCEP